MDEEKKLETKTVFNGRAFNVRIDTIEVRGRKTTREIVEHDECVAMVPVDASGNVLLVEQFRTAVGKPLLEIPAGGIDPGEDPETAGRREMQEETGHLPGKVVKLGGFYSSPGYSTEFLHLYLVTDLRPGRLYAEDTEGIKVVATPVDKIIDLIDSGRICDAKSIAGLLVFLHRRTLPGRPA